MPRRRTRPTIAPLPDRITGEPRPPDAPRRFRGSHITPTDREPVNPPPTPDGYGPALEWSQLTRNDRWHFVGYLVLASITLGFANNGLTLHWLVDWPSIGWMSLLTAALCVLVWRLTKSDWMAAGADWVQHDKAFVDTYHLTRITTTTAGYYPAINLEDDQGRTATISFGMYQRHTAMWNLIYNGIVTSIANGTCDTSPYALDALQLPATFGPAGTAEKGKAWWLTSGGLGMIVFGGFCVDLAFEIDDKLLLLSGIVSIGAGLFVFWKLYLSKKRNTRNEIL
ncbi:hypothetical protein ABH922_003656 [Rhodococcus sp. 27YEA15]|uniref:hypothetical protein n=1 Tax=Rhodococcus sp. 27YEA15 TaxID=3156259 RepID=UPI003C7C9044